MVLDTFRWFMSTVAQTLGAVSAIILAAYIMWVQKQRAIKEEILTTAKQVNDEISKWTCSVVNYFNFNSLYEFFEYPISIGVRNKSIVQISSNNEHEYACIVDLLIDIHKKDYSELMKIENFEKRVKEIENLHFLPRSFRYKILDEFLNAFEISKPENKDILIQIFLQHKLKQKHIDLVRENLYVKNYREEYNKLFTYHDKYQDASKEIQKSQQLWIPLLLSFVTIIGSLAAMMFDGCIVYTWYWGWILTSAVMLFAGTALGWYLVFLYRVISPRSSRERKKQA